MITREEVEKLRYLDFDDMLLLALFEDHGGKFKSVANFMFLTPPAICHRRARLEKIFDRKLFIRTTSGGSEFTRDGRRVAEIAKGIVRQLIEVRTV